jgi:metal-responsive CopG/Arc/MetJ family transcriptional regulator
MGYVLDGQMELFLEHMVGNVADIHLSLSQDLLQSLDRLAYQRGMRRAHLVREVIAEYLTRMESERIEQEMNDYVEALAPHSGEFVSETEAHAVQRLLDETEW